MQPVTERERTAESTRPSGWLVPCLAGLGGLVLGGLTLLGQGTLPGHWNQLTNSGAVWSAGAFVAGWATRARGWRPVVAGTLALLGAVIGYYACTTVLLDQPLTGTSVRGPLVWAVVGLVAGPIFGTAGSWLRHPRLARRITAYCLLGGVFLAEALFLMLALHYRFEATVMIVIGLAAALTLGRSARERLWTLLVLVPVALLGVAGYLLLNVLVSAAFLT